MKDKLIIFGVIGAAIGVVLYMGISNSFHARCNKAGYEAAEHEACIKRVSAGGPVYKENIGKWK